MGRGDTNPHGIPPSRNTVWNKPDVPEEVFESNWERIFGQTGPNRELKSEFEKKEDEVRHRIKQVDNLGRY